jgi:hypothetical protein
MFITFGVVLLARTWGKIIMDNQHYKRRAEGISTVMEDQTEEWHQYVPPEK